MAHVRSTPIQGGDGNSFQVFFEQRLENEWLGWSKETFRNMEFLGAAASMTFSLVFLLGVYVNGVLSKEMLAAFGADLLVSAGALLAPYFVQEYDPWIRTRVSVFLRVFYVPLLSWGVLSSLVLTPMMATKEFRFLAFFLPVHLLLGTLRFPLRYREHLVAQLAATAVSGCASGLLCLKYFADVEEQELIRKAGSFLALASTGLTIEGDTSITASCMTLSLQVQAIFGIFPTLWFVYCKEWSSRKAFLESKVGVEKKMS
ncbi:hypothetical protein BSKO_07133 [Bryopsis sp. KO-2023]|nr:hypothetical protein BSKO_07133 [Bryopsis sp. KO-2023]